MKKLVYLVFALTLLTGCGVGTSAAPEAAYRQISMDEAIGLMESEYGYIILDVRTAAEFEQAHIPGAINIANESISSEPPARLPDKGQLILVYCRSGNRSKQAAEKLAAMGYTNIVEFGGIIDWPGETQSGSSN